jgi:hypothetical protein
MTWTFLAINMPDVESLCFIVFAFHFERHSVTLKRMRGCPLEYSHLVIEDGSEPDGNRPEVTLIKISPVSNSEVF